MATKSFESEFKFNKREAQSLADALDNSKRVDIVPKRSAHFVTTDKEIHELFDDILGKK